MAELRKVRVAGTGSFLPERVVTNAELSQALDTSDEWIRSRTGIGERHFARADQAASDLALPAARRALEAAGVQPGDVDLIVVSTMTGDYLMPSMAALLQRDLGCEKAGGYDINSACSGFVLAFTTGANYVRTGQAECVLVVGVEKMSSITDPTDRSTAVIFADGAGAAVLRSAGPDDPADILAVRHGLRGDADVLTVPAGGSRHPTSAQTVAERAHYIQMKGRETFKFAVTTFAGLIKDACDEAGVSVDDLAVIVPHQVNQRILESACVRAKIDIAKCYVNIERVGNTSAASVAIALDEAARAGRMQRGDLVLLVAFGGGLSWAATLLRW